MGAPTQLAAGKLVVTTSAFGWASATRRSPLSVSRRSTLPTRSARRATVTLTEVTRPSATDDGQHAPALQFGDPRVMAAMSAIVGFSHLLTGFDNKTLTELMGALLDAPYTSRQATYDLRRLRRKGIIERIEHTHRYLLTPGGRAVAVLFTKAYGRVLGPGLAALDPGLPDDLSRRSELATAWRTLDRALDRFIDDGLAAA